MSELDHLLSGHGVQYKEIDDIYRELGSSSNGLTNAQAREIRSKKGANEVPTPINYPAWLCCLLPCLLKAPTMVLYNECVPEQCFIRRDNRWLKMDAHSIVPGDIIKIKAGERVAADIRIIEATDDCAFSTKCISTSVPEKQGTTTGTLGSYENSPNMAFLGYKCVSGECTGIAVATGQETLLAGLINRNEWPPKQL